MVLSGVEVPSVTGRDVRQLMLMLRLLPVMYLDLQLWIRKVG